MHNTKNYGTDGGDTWVIGGKLIIEEGATVEGLNQSGAYVPDSDAGTVAALKADFNRLLAALREAGILKAGDQA